MSSFIRIRNAFLSQAVAVLFMIALLVEVLPAGAQGQAADISLTPADITFSNSNPTSGEIISINAKIHNGGPSAATNVVVEFLAANVPIPPSKTIASIPALSSGDASHQWMAPVPGTYTIKVEANADQNDPNAANNVAERTITVGTVVPTINVTATITPETIQSKGEFTVNGSAEMGGEPVSNGAVKIEVLQVGYTNETTTASDGTFSLAMVGPTEQGKFDVKVSVTQGAVTGETQLNLTVLQPDMTITRMTLSPQDATEGDTVKVSVGVQNIGNGTASGVKFQLKVDNVLVYEKDLGDMSNGETSSVTYNWKSKKGSHDFSAMVDPNNTIDEIKEDNNAWPTQNINIKAKKSDKPPIPSFEAAVFALSVLVIFFIMRNGRGRKYERKPQGK